MSATRPALALVLVMGCAACAVTPSAKPIVPAPFAVSAEKDAKANPSNWPAAASPNAITSPATEAAIAALLAQMTIEQKVG
ncbi:MAG: hypothetical protein RLZZ157_430, partial [Pseudomonadota bacterium]